MKNEILSATLPEARGIRADLIAQLKSRFGERLGVWNDFVFAFPPESSEKVLPFGETDRQIWERAGFSLRDDEEVVFAGSAVERRLSRAIFTEPTQIIRRKSGMFLFKRRFSVGDLFAAVDEKGGVKHVVFLGTADNN